MIGLASDPEILLTVSAVTNGARDSSKIDQERPA
jgi:hypothetical protein